MWRRRQAKDEHQIIPISSLPSKQCSKSSHTLEYESSEAVKFKKKGDEIPANAFLSIRSSLASRFSSSFGFPTSGLSTYPIFVFHQLSKETSHVLQKQRWGTHLPQLLVDIGSENKELEAVPLLEVL